MQHGIAGDYLGHIVLSMLVVLSEVYTIRARGARKKKSADGDTIICVQVNKCKSNISCMLQKYSLAREKSKMRLE